MSILDSITEMVGKHPQTNQQQHATLVQSAMQTFGNHGGLSGLVQSAETQGLGHVVQSWIGTGSNQPIGASQLQGLVGQDRLNEIAKRAGIPPSITGEALTGILPVVVDKFTPNGRMPQAA